ncbi:glycosyltransferase family 4 protein [Candidatus Shapirobacteria bacterium]|nr:glycosyltransferase family 4 protein [Candidatus Shapirobacteria bacterium]
MSLKAGIYDPYLDTLGGGERYTLTVAEILSQHDYDVDIFWSGDKDIISKASSRFSLDLSSINLVPDIFHVCPDSVDFVESSDQIKQVSLHHNTRSTSVTKAKEFLNKLQISHQYDLFFYVTDGSLPFIFSKKNLLHFQVPFSHQFNPLQLSLNHLKLKQFSKIVCNSKFTKKIIDQNYHTQSEVLYPPVDVAKFFNNYPKENIILSVGRFDNVLNAKKQDVLIDAFKLLPRDYFQSWKLVLMGGSLEDPSKNNYLKLLQQQSAGFPIEFVVNPDFKQLQHVYGHSKIYWHAAGHEVDEDIHPETTEHFGMAVVEAMASGLVPIIVKKGGLPEIIHHQHNGYLWGNLSELTKFTSELINDSHKLSEMSNKAVKSSLSFSKEKFTENLMNLLK